MYNQCFSSVFFTGFSDGHCRQLMEGFFLYFVLINRPNQIQMSWIKTDSEMLKCSSKTLRFAGLC